MTRISILQVVMVAFGLLSPAIGAEPLSQSEKDLGLSAEQMALWQDNPQPVHPLRPVPQAVRCAHQDIRPAAQDAPVAVPEVRLTPQIVKSALQDSRPVARRLPVVLGPSPLMPVPSAPSDQRDAKGAAAVTNKAPVLSGPFEILDQAEELSIIVHRSKLLRSQTEITRTAIVDPSICDVAQYTMRDVAIIGKAIGATNVTFWFSDPNVAPRTYLVRIIPDPATKITDNEDLLLLEKKIAELFPNSKVKLMTVGEKLLVTGQARDAQEAAEIMTILRGEAVDQQGHWITGPTASGRPGETARTKYNGLMSSANIINLLKIPGVQQVALRVKIAELNRTAARTFSADASALITFQGGSILLNSLINASSGQTILGQFDQNKLKFALSYLEEHGVVRLLSEPTLVTLSGHSANFVAGGEFAVPTAVGVGGIGAVTTDFRAFGAIISFTPIVIDKDLIRLQVSPEFSQVNQGLAVGGTPGLTTRAVTTTVEMRAGQTLALAGLLDESMKNGTSSHWPWLTKILSSRDNSRQETELIILVTPELVHPMEPEEVPPLPGFDVTEPDNWQFIGKGEIEGTPTREYRSTVWPQLQNRYKAGGSPLISGPFGHSTGDCPGKDMSQ